MAAKACTYRLQGLQDPCTLYLKNVRWWRAKDAVDVVCEKLEAMLWGTG